MRRCCLKLACLLLCIVMMPGCVGSEKKEVKAGTSYTVNVTMLSKLRMIFPDVDNKKTDLSIDFKVLDVTPEGKATVEGNISSIYASLKSLSINLKYDSKEAAESKAADDKQQKFVDTLSPLNGATYKVEFDTKNNTSSIVYMDEVIKGFVESAPDGDMYGGDQAKMILNETSLIDYASAGVLGAVMDMSQTDKSWQSPGKVVIPMTPIIPVQRTYKVDSIETVDSDKQAKISCEISGLEESQDEGDANAVSSRPKTTFKLESIAGIGNIVYSVSDGVLVEMTEKLKVRVSNAKKMPARRNDDRPAPKIYYNTEKTITCVSH